MKRTNYDENYRDAWLAQRILKDEKVVGFFTREYYCLDNFSSFSVSYKGVVFQTVEHAYQTEKFVDPDVRELIIHAMSAHDAKRIAHEHADKIRDDWNDVKVEIMEQLLRDKFAQHEYVRKKLRQTAGKTICEDSPVDDFWGCGADGSGQNQLGKLWMKIRNEMVEDR